MTMSILKIPRQFNKDKRYGIIGVGENSRKLVFDIKYVFKDKLNVGDAIYLDENAELNPDLDGYICCSYDRDDAIIKLSKYGLKHKRDFFFAEDLFGLLNDWDKKKIAFKTSKGNFYQRLMDVIFGYVAEHEILLPADSNRETLTCGKHKQNNSALLRRIYYIYCLVLGLIKILHQIGANKNNYQNYDYICFARTSDALSFRNNHPELTQKVITLEELRTHTFAPLYMRATYYDRRQDDCACNMPFHTVWIGNAGTTRLCECPDYLNIGCGNAGLTDLSKIWQSPVTKIIRLSCLNNTYSFCSREECGKLSKDRVCTKVLEPREEIVNDYPSIVNVANDNVCNLHCPSCRKKAYVKNDEDVQREIDACLDELFKSNWLNMAETLYVGGGGEIFLSNNYKRVLYGSDSKRKNVTIMTNGTLFTQKEWEQLEGKYEHINFMVSVDAATKDTYEKVRCGGNWKKLMDNMDFMSNLRKENKIDKVTVIMIVQKANYKEIPDFIKWAKDMGFDRVSLSHIRNWWTFEDGYFYDNVSMFDRNGRIKTELKEIMDNPICSDSVVVTSW